MGERRRWGWKCFPRRWVLLRTWSLEIGRAWGSGLQRGSDTRASQPVAPRPCQLLAAGPSCWSHFLCSLGPVSQEWLCRGCACSPGPQGAYGGIGYNQAQPLPQVPTAEAGQLASTSPSTSTYPTASSALPAASSLSTLPSSSSFGPASAPYTGKMVVSPAGMQVQAVPFICCRNKCGPFLKTNPSPPLIFLSAS